MSEMKQGVEIYSPPLETDGTLPELDILVPLSRHILTSDLPNGRKLIHASTTSDDIEAMEALAESGAIPDLPDLCEQVLSHGPSNLRKLANVLRNDYGITHIVRENGVAEDITDDEWSE